MKKMSRTNFVGVVLKKDNKILLMKNRSRNSEQDGTRGFPGGHLKEHESYMDCISREVAEELKIKITSKTETAPLILHAVDKKEQTIFLGRYVLCDQWTNTPRNNEPDKCSKISRFSKENLPEKISPYVKRVLDSFDEGKHYVEMEI